MSSRQDEAVLDEPSLWSGRLFHRVCVSARIHFLPSSTKGARHRISFLAPSSRIKDPPIPPSGPRSTIRARGQHLRWETFRFGVGVQASGKSSLVIEAHMFAKSPNAWA